MSEGEPGTGQAARLCAVSIIVLIKSLAMEEVDTRCLVLLVRDVVDGVDVHGDGAIDVGRVVCWW